MTNSPWSNQVLHGIKWSYFSAILSAVLRIVVLSVLSHLLSPRDFGLLGIALIFTNFVERIGQIGIGPTIVQRIDLSEDKLRSAMTFSILTGCFVYLLLLLCSPLIANFFNEPTLPAILSVLSLMFVIEGFCTISDSLLQRSLKFKNIAVAENSAYLLGSGLTSIALAYLGYGIWSLVIGMVLTRLIRAIIIIQQEPIIPKLFGWIKEVRTLLHSGVGFSLGKIFNFFALYGDNLVTGKLLGTESLGLYTRSYQLMTLPSTYFAQIIDKVLFPALSKKQYDKDHLNSTFCMGIEIVALIGIPLTAFFYYVANDIVLVIFGKKWIEMIPVFQVLALGSYFRIGYKVGDTFSRSTGAVYRHAGINALYCMIVLCGSIVGSAYGLTGIAYAVLVAVGINDLLMTRLGMKISGATSAQVFDGYKSGIWVGLILTLSLIFIVPTLTTYVTDLYLRFVLICLLSLVVFVLSLILAPKYFKIRYIKFGKLKKFGEKL